MVLLLLEVSIANVIFFRPIGCEISDTENGWMIYSMVHTVVKRHWAGMNVCPNLSPLRITGENMAKLWPDNSVPNMQFHRLYILGGL